MKNRSKNYLRLAIFVLEKVAKQEPRLKDRLVHLIEILEDMKNGK